MRSWTSLAVVALLVSVGCAPQAEPPVDEEPAATAEWQAIAPEQMTDAQKAQHERCLAAVNSLASEMMGELMAALDSGGPAEGIAVCQGKAPQVAAQVAEAYGLDIGRTSFALRNTSNTAPPWAEELVAERVGEPVYLAGPTGELGALLPIRLKAECQMCHGPEDAIADEVLSAIAEHYPEDRATGFAAGDLRGWFWVEVPAGVTEVEM
jgi:hypothetical protein